MSELGMKIHDHNLSFRRLRQEDHEFRARLGYSASSRLKNSQLTN